MVGLISRATKGAGASLSDKHALTFLRALYDLMRVNIAYETTPGDIIDGLRRAGKKASDYRGPKLQPLRPAAVTTRSLHEAKAV